MGMSRTLDCFQSEWYELQHKGLLREESTDQVPDVYTQNSNLDTEVNIYIAI